MKRKNLLLKVLGIVFFLTLFWGQKVAADTGLYRLYHPGLQVHLYTTDSNEYKVLGTRGWSQEGLAWTTSDNKGETVYRLYHPGLKVHLYTKDTNEYKVLATRGWKQEGPSYRSYGSMPIYRLYHPGIKKHLYTKDENENKVLGTRGWIQEGIAFYGLKTNDNISHQDPGNKEILISGTATDSKGQVIKNTTLSLEVSGKKIESISVPADGYFYFHIEKNKTYIVSGTNFKVEILAKTENDIQIKKVVGNFQLGRQSSSAAGQVTLQPSTIDLKDVTNYQVNESAKQVTLPTNQEVQTGDDIILPPSAQYPNGYAFEVVSATSSNGKTTIQTRETSFDQLVKQADVETTQLLGIGQFIPADEVQVLPSNYNSSSVHQENGAIAQTGTINVKLSKDGVSIEASLTGEIRAGMEYNVFELQKTKIFVSPSFSIKAKLAYSKDKKAKTVFPLGIIPISLYNTLRVNALVSAIVTVDGKVEIAISAESKFSGEIGLKEMQPYSSITNTLTTSLELTLSGEKSSGISLDFKPGIAQIDLGNFDIGSYTGVEGEISTKLVSKNLSNPTVEWLTGKATLFSKITAGYEIKIGIGNFKAIDLEGRFTDKKLMEYELSSSSYTNESTTTTTIEPTTTDSSTSTQPGTSGIDYSNLHQVFTTMYDTNVLNNNSTVRGMLEGMYLLPSKNEGETLKRLFFNFKQLEKYAGTGTHYVKYDYQLSESSYQESSLFPIKIEKVKELHYSDFQFNIENRILIPALRGTEFDYPWSYTEAISLPEATSQGYLDTGTGEKYLDIIPKNNGTYSSYILRTVHANGGGTGFIIYPIKITYQDSVSPIVEIKDLISNYIIFSKLSLDTVLRITYSNGKQSEIDIMSYYEGNVFNTSPTQDIYVGINNISQDEWITIEISDKSENKSNSLKIKYGYDTSGRKIVTVQDLVTGQIKTHYP